jgi:hypothetical protein
VETKVTYHVPTASHSVTLVITPYKRLTLQKPTKQANLPKGKKKVVKGKMYILPDFSLKTTLT